MNRFEMVKGRCAAEVPPFDQADRQPTLRRIVGNREAVNAASDDEEIELSRGKRRHISNQAATIL